MQTILFLLAGCHHDCLAPGTPGTAGACCVDDIYDHCDAGLDCNYSTFTCDSTCGAEGERCCSMRDPICDGDLSCVPGATGHYECSSCGSPGGACCAGESCPGGGVCTDGSCMVSDTDCFGSVTATFGARSPRAVDFHCSLGPVTARGDTLEEARACAESYTGVAGVELVEDISELTTLPFCIHTPFGSARGDTVHTTAWSDDDARDCAEAACGGGCLGVEEGVCPE